ncbi:MAG: hypothetical protein ACRC4X_08390, partial [Cetobacterium sp.]
FSEIHNVKILKSWSYSNLMPIIPIIDVGIVPIIQWLILPTLIIYLSRPRFVFSEKSHFFFI